MARTVRDAKLETSTARSRLRVQDAPYWKTLVPGQLHLGYRKRRRDAPGTWTVRRYLGLDAGGVGRYAKEMLAGVADDYQDADGETVLSYAEAQGLAFAKAKTKRAEKRRAPTVEIAIEDYLKHLRTEAKSSVGDAENRARTHILPNLGRVKVEALTPEQLMQWRDELADQPARKRTRPGAEQQYKDAAETKDEKRARKATVNRTLTVLKAALNHQVDLQKVRDSGAWAAVKPFPKTDAARPGFLTAEQATRLIAAADETSGFRDLVRAALITGCRYGELCALKVGDLIRGAGATRMIHIRDSKSGDPRDVRLHDEDSRAFFETLCRGRAADETMLLRRPPVTPQHPTPRDPRPWAPSDQARPMAAAYRRALSLDDNAEAIGFHQLRHTWASLAVMNGMPLNIVAKNLGHANTRMVEKHYAHLGEDYIDRIMSETAPRFGIAPSPSVVVQFPAGGRA